MPKQKKSRRSQLIEKNWNNRFSELQKYYKKHGDCHVPITRNRQNPLYSLAQWVKRTRSQYKTKAPFLTAEKIDKLKALGFSWRSTYKPGELNRVKDADLLNDLRRLYKLLGKAPNPQEIVKYGKHGLQTFRSHFGSTARARQAAGITDKLVAGKLVRGKTYSDTQLLDELKRLAKKVGRRPTSTDMIKYGKYSCACFSTRFGSFSTAIKKAGLECMIDRKHEDYHKRWGLK